MTVVIDASFNPIPSLDQQPQVVAAAEAQAAAQAVFVSTEGELPSGVTVSREALAAVGFTAKPGQTYPVAGETLTVLVGVGEKLETQAQVRDAAAAFTRAASEIADLAVDVRGLAISASEAAQAVVEGSLLARYRWDELTTDPKTVTLEKLTVVTDDEKQATEGIERGLVLARIAGLARDLANTPPRHLSAEKFGEIAQKLAPEFGLEVEVYDRAQIMELGLGGLLGVNAGSTEEPRMIKVMYRPENAKGHLALVGKGIMYDSGGISLKPSNAMHAAMKFDMMGAAAVFSSMTSLRELGVEHQVTGWLMCTDNMPSGSATKLGDVLTIRGGTTVEVKNTDAEGRLVLADGLVLATEEEQRPDAIIDIATLTGAAQMALGERTAAMLANNDEVAAQLEAAALVSDENIWRMPLDHRYREQLKSNTADLSNIGGSSAGLILAGLFLNEFVDGIAWGHLDIAGTMMSDKNDLWRSTGSTGFGARLLAEFAAAFEAPRQ
ncbi:leucyl aminopeptidase [Leucobacter chinensis]|uniref:leucyl aminopeptidase n=1 Tax=Leucobacter chinensis TaxID=2851010 RepID=UPI001C22C452|nr:leucyl aminopeptidase [Leucobacter chinensis]